MARYNVKYKDLQKQATSLQSIGKTLASFESKLNSIANAMDGRDSSMASLKTQIKNSAKQLPSLSNRLTSGGAAVSSISALYLSEEKLAYGNLTQVKKVTMGMVAGSGAVGALILATGVAVVSGATVVNTKNVKSFLWNRIKDRATATYNAGVNVVKTTNNVVSWIKDKIGPDGKYEGVWKAVTTTTKLITGATLLATSVATGNPLGIIYGANMLISASADLYYIDKGNLDKVGKTDILKSAMKTGGEVIGENFGAGIGYIIGGDEGARTGATIGKSAGSTVGSIVYTVGGIYAAASVGKTVVSGNKTVSELTKISSYSATKKVIEGADAIAKGEIVGFVAGEVVGKYADDYIESDRNIPKDNYDLNVYNEVVKKSGEKAAEELAKPKKAVESGT